MDTGTFSTSDVEPYEVDGLFLSALRERLMDTVRAIVEPDSFGTETLVTFKPDRHSEIERKDTTGAILTDGSVPRPQSVEISVNGQMRGSEDWGDRIHVSLRLRANGGDHLYAKGPADEARLCFETMRGAMATKAMPKSIARSVTASGRPRWRRTTTRARWVAAPVGFLAYLVGLLALHGVLSAIFAIGGLTVLAAAPLSYLIEDFLVDHRRAAEKVPEPTPTPVNVINLGRVEFGSVPMIEHRMTLPTILQ